MAHVRDGAMLKCTGRMNSNENTNWRHGTVKAKVIIILSTVAVLHLVLGGMFLTGGCAPEDPPMPPGIYVPQPTAKPAPQQDETSAMLSAPATETEEYKQQIDHRKDAALPDDLSAPAADDKTKTAPAPEKTPEPKKTAPAMTDKDTTYVVQKGDSLWKIARMYGISVAELAAYNNIVPSKPIRIGQKLIIPAGSKAVKQQKPAAGTADRKAPKKSGKKKAAGTRSARKTARAAVPADGIYIVKEGDSFSKIAAKYGVTVSAIAAANPGVSSNRLQIGQKLNLPTGSKAAAAAPAAVEKQASSGAPATGKTAALDEELLLKDIQNPDAATAPLNTSAPAPAANGTEAVPAAPAGDKPLASEDAVKAVSGTAAPAADANLPASLTDTAVPATDTTIDALAAQYGIKADDIKTLNPALPADGKIKAGTVVQLP